MYTCIHFEMIFFLNWGFNWGCMLRALTVNQIPQNMNVSQCFLSSSTLSMTGSPGRHFLHFFREYSVLLPGQPRYHFEIHGVTLLHRVPWGCNAFCYRLSTDWHKALLTLQFLVSSLFLLLLSIPQMTCFIEGLNMLFYNIYNITTFGRSFYGPRHGHYKMPQQVLCRFSEREPWIWIDWY